MLMGGNVGSKSLERCSLTDFKEVGCSVTSKKCMHKKNVVRCKLLDQVFALYTFYVPGVFLLSFIGSGRKKRSCELRLA